MSQPNGASRQMAFLNESDPVSLLNSNNYLDQLVPIIKTHLENDSIGELIQTLKLEGSKKDEELVQTVNANEDKIAESADDIASISRNTASMNDQILDINDHLAKTSNLTFEKKFQLLALKKNINKIHESEILINKILQVLELTDKTHELIKNNKFFPALKSLNDLTSLNKEFDRDFIFLSNIDKSIPILKNLIRDESLGLLKRSLTAVENKFEPMGTSYYQWFAAVVSQFNEYKHQNREYSEYKVNSPVEVSLRSSYLRVPMPDVDDFVNLGFVYDTLLIFKTLGQTDVLKSELNKEMNMRRDKIFYPFISSDNKNEQFGQYIRSNQNLSLFLNKLMGYLVFHKSISDRIPSIINMKTTDLWENLSTKIYPHLKNLVMNEILQLERLVEIKKIIGNFYLTLEHFHFNTDQIYNILIFTYQKYAQISIHLFGEEFQKTANEDDAMPMSIYDLKLYKKIRNVAWYKDERLDHEIRFPLSLPFSQVYPMACARMRNFISQQSEFLQDYYKFDLNKLHEALVNDIDGVLQNAIDRYFQMKLKESVSTEELAQNLINMEYFLIMSKEVSNLLSSKFEVTIILRVVESFSTTRKQTEEKLFEVIDNKMFDLLELADWDWDTREINREPTFFIRDMGEFLQNLFNSALSKLPLSVKTLLLYRVFDLLAKEFMDSLNQQPGVTRAALANFDQDISYIERVTKDLNPSKADRSGSDRESLQSMFLQLRQRINLLKAGNLEDYKDQATRMRHFDQIKPEDAVSLVQKLRD